MRGVKSLLELQNKCVNLSSFVQDVYPIIYYSASFGVVRGALCLPAAFFGSIVYNRAIVYKRQILPNVLVYVIVTDQCNQTTLSG